MTSKRHKIRRVGSAVALWVAGAGVRCQVFEWSVMQESKAVDWMLSFPASAFLVPPAALPLHLFFAFSFLPLPSYL